MITAFTVRLDDTYNISLVADAKICVMGPPARFRKRVRYIIEEGKSRVWESGRRERSKKSETLSDTKDRVDEAIL